MIAGTASDCNVRIFPVHWNEKHMNRTYQTKRGGNPLGRIHRFDARLNEDQKKLLQRAADLEGRSLTDFVLRSAEAAAERTIRERATLVLSIRDSQTFVDAILNPPAPGRVLRKAFRQYRRRIGI